MLNEKEYFLTLWIFIIAIALTSVITLNKHSGQTPEDVFSISGHPIIEYRKLNYNSLSKTMKDSTGLKFNMGEKTLINNKRGFEFVVRNSSEEYKLDYLNPDKEFLKDNYNFVKETDSKGVLIKEEFNFSEESSVKIVHSVNNTNKFNLKNPVYYYVFDLFPEDEIRINGSLCDYQGKCKFMGKTEKDMVLFNSEYYFSYHDLIKTGFSLSDINFENSKLYLGFTSDKSLSLDSGNSIELDPTFYYYLNVTSTDIAPLSNNMFVMAFYQNTGDYVGGAYFAIYYTNGTQFGNNVTLNSNTLGGYTNGIGVDAFNSTHFVISWYSSLDNGVSFSIYDTDFNLIVNQTYWDSHWGACSDVATLNSTHFVLAWNEDDEYDLTRWRLYDAEGNAINTAQPDSTIGNSSGVSIATFNSTHLVDCFFDDEDDIIYCDVYDAEGQWNNRVSVDSVYDYADFVSVATFNSTHYVVGWYDSFSDDASFDVFDAEGNEITGVLDADDDVGYSWSANKVSVATLNSTHFAITWYDDSDGDVSYAIYDAEGNANTGILDAETSASGSTATTVSYKTATGLGICNNNFILSWENISDKGIWAGYYPNGTLWDGVCIAEGPKITIISPINSTYSPGTINLNISATSDNSTITNCNYSLNGGTTNNTLIHDGDYWYGSSYFNVGSYTVTYFCRDNASINVNAKVSFTTKISPIDIDPNGWSYDSADITPLGLNKFILAYSRGTGDYGYHLYFDIYYTNGTQFGNTVYIGFFAYEGVHVQAFNSTHFVIAWSTSNSGTSYNGDDLFSIYNTDFQVISNWTLIDDGSWTGVDVAVLNSTHFVAAYPTSQPWGGNAYFEVFDSKGNLVTDETEVEHSICLDDYCNVAVAALNSTHFVYCYFNNYDEPWYNSLFCEVWSMDGVYLAGSQVEPDYDVGNYSMALEVAAINSTHYVVSWMDALDADNTLAVYNIAGQQIALFDSDTVVNTGSWDKDSEVAILNSTHFVSAWTNPNDEFNATFRIYDTKGNANTGIINASINIQGDPATYYVAGISPVASEVAVTGIGICQDNFIMAWNETSNGEGLVWMGYKSDGTPWDGRCDDIEITIISPTSETQTSKSVWFNITATSASYSISKCIYSLDGSSNYSMTNSGSLWHSLMTTTFGSHSVDFYCNNTLGNWSSESINFYVDDGNSSCTWWYNTAWNFRKNIIIDKDMVNGTQTNFPLLINISDSSLNLYSQSDGDDLLFTSVDGCSKLDHEIEYWNKASGWLVVWVRIPILLSSSDTIINMYYGNNLSQNQENVEGVWNSGFETVHHLEENPSSSDFLIYDSTSKNNHGKTFGTMTSGDLIVSKIGYGFDFDGVDDYVTTYNQYDNPQEFSISAWVKTNVAEGYKIFGFETDQIGEDSTNWDRMIYIGDDGLGYSACYDGDGDEIVSSTSLDDNSWHYVVSVRNDTSNEISIYIDGELEDFTSNNYAEDYAGYWRIAAYANAWWTNSNSGYFQGKIDEVRVNNVALSSGWINTSYMNQAFPSLFYSVGGESPYSCNYIGTGIWNINCSHNCTLTSNVVVDGSNITITGPGTVMVTANITNFGKLTITGGAGGNCRITCKNGGCFK